MQENNKTIQQTCHNYLQEGCEQLKSFQYRELITELKIKTTTTEKTMSPNCCCGGPRK
jgi:hypothetical protein